MSNWGGNCQHVGGGGGGAVICILRGGKQYQFGGYFVTTWGGGVNAAPGGGFCCPLGGGGGCATWEGQFATKWGDNLDLPTPICYMKTRDKTNGNSLPLVQCSISCIGDARRHRPLKAGETPIFLSQNLFWKFFIGP